MLQNQGIDRQHRVSEMNVRMNRRRIFRQKPNGSTENLCLGVLYHLTQSRTSKAANNFYSFLAVLSEEMRYTKDGRDAYVCLVDVDFSISERQSKIVTAVKEQCNGLFIWFFSN